MTLRVKGKYTLNYQIHRAVDQKREVITATEVTPGEVHESHRLESSMDTHEKKTETTVETAVADSKYGSKDIKTRQHLMERTFAQATRYGYQRTRWESVKQGKRIP